MNLIIGMAIVTCLLAGEWELSRTEHPLIAAWLTLGLTASVPMVALFQVWFVQNTWVFAQQDSSGSEDVELAKMHSVRLNRLASFHTAIWLAAMLTIFGLVGWPTVVLDSFALRGFGILGKLVMITPAVVSLVFSWAVFYPIESSGYSRPNQKGPYLIRKITHEWFNMIQWVILRFRMQVLLVLLPFLVLFALNDLVSFCNHVHPLLTLGLLTSCLAVGITYYPIAIRWLLGLQPVSLKSLSSKENNNGVTFWCWCTNHRVVNACAVGNRWFRQVFVSDRMLRDFPRRELLAVVRHELAHLQLNHGRQRMMFVMLPVIVFALAGMMIRGSAVFDWSPDSSSSGVMLMCFFLMVVYLWLTLSWLSKEMEFEADLVGCCEKDEGILRKCPELTEAMSQALLRLAAYNPAQWERGGWLYPALRSRIEAIETNAIPVDEILKRNHLRRLRVSVMLAAVWFLISSISFYFI